MQMVGSSRFLKTRIQLVGSCSFPDFKKIFYADGWLSLSLAIPKNLNATGWFLLSLRISKNIFYGDGWVSLSPTISKNI
jgi:hypothetical protein